MSLSIGIIGLPNVGKSTLFNALLKKQAALAANYPFATIEPNVGIVAVPDERLQKLVDFVRMQSRVDKDVPKKITPAVIKFVDIAGLVKGASQGQGLGNKFLSHIREVDALIHVVRAFEDKNVVRAGSIDPESDIAIINTELILADLQTLEKRIDAEQRNAKKHVPNSFEKLSVYARFVEVLNKGELAATLALTDPEHALIKDLNLLTTKPVIHVLNVSESDVVHGEHALLGNNVVYLCARLEAEIAILSPQEREEYLSTLGIHVSGLDRVIKRGYDLLGLHTFFTAGSKEVRAWTVSKGFNARQAAGVIHSDFARGFIAAEVIAFTDLLQFLHTGVTTIPKNLARLEGKDYIVVDGDVIEFRFSV